MLGTASLDTMGGLISFASPQDLPEGASPRCFDVDFIVGSVFTRPGLAPVYTFANVLIISQMSIGSADIGTFTYAGPTPTINEGFLLGGFTGTATFLNGQTVYVIAVGLNTFTAQVSGPPGTYLGLGGTATSTTGSFVGPNPPTVAQDINTGGEPWSNIDNILGDTGYASVVLGPNSRTIIPTTATSSSGQFLWTNPSHVLNTGASVATITLPNGSGNTEGNAIAASGMPFDTPADATITGLLVTVAADCSVAGSGALVVELFDSTNSQGSPQVQPLTTTLTTYTFGSSTFTWGLTQAQLSSLVMSSNFNINITANAFGRGSGNINFAANSLSVTLYYSVPESDELQGRTFNFALASTIGITGFLTTFQAYSTGGASLSLQLVKNGVAVGTPIVQVLNSTPTIYSLGGSNNLWGSTWSPADVNSLGFGVQFIASESTTGGTTFLNDVDITIFVTPNLANFNYIKSYIQNNGQITTLILDAEGDVYQEDVTHNPGVLTLALTGILPGSFAQSATADNNEYLMFSDLSIGTDRPRVVHPNAATGVLQYLPLSQVGPGAPPSFQAAISAGTGALDITGYSVTSNVVTFTFVITSPPTTPVVGSLYTIQGIPGAPFDNKTLTVLGTPAPDTTHFSAAFVMPNATVTGLNGTSTPTTNYGILSITQNPSTAFNGQEILLSAGPGSTSPGNTITFYYGGAGAVEDPTLLATFKAGYQPVVYISGGLPANFSSAVGTWLVTGHGIGKPPGESGQVPFFTITYNVTAYIRQITPGNNGQFQFSWATIITSSPIPNLSAGDSIQINGASPAAWNNNWKIEDALKSGVVNITSSQLLAGGIAQFQYNLQTGVNPVNGQYITLSQLTNLAALNTIGVVSAATGSTFQVAGFAAFTAAEIGAGIVPEAGQGVTFGTTYVFDPGIDYVGSITDPIYGNAGAGGTVTIIGGSIIPIGSGTRQAICFFITETDFWSPASPYVVFTTSEDANFILANNIPIGPPNTVARGIAFTEAGQNGVPGANFYVIENPVTITVGPTSTTYSSTIIRDNVTSSARFTFTDAVLLNSTEIDIQGNDLFNEIELGSSAWVVPYASRNFYGLQLNKVDEFDNLSFDGGYLSNNPQGVPSFDVALLGGSFTNLQPSGYPHGQPGVGWNIVNPVDQTLISSPVTGLALYILNTYTVGVTPSVGMIFQTAYQNQYGTAIIEPNVAYSVRVTASNPSGNNVGNLVIDLVDYNSVIGFSHVTPPYGQFVIPLSSMTSEMQVFTGTLLTTPFIGTVAALASTTVPVSLVLREWLQNSVFGSDVLIDRVEVFTTLTPYLKAQVYGSYVNDLEAIDGSDNGGIIDTTSENAQPVYGGFVMHDLLYLLKQSSWYSTEQNPNSEPGGWGIKEVSNKVGACGIHAYDTGEEWALTACRGGIFGFNGGQPVKLTLEIFNLWDTINWEAANTIVLRNDINNKRFYCWVPLPTGTSPTGVPTATVQWLPNAPYNPAPTSPNVCLTCNYQGLDTAAELFAGPGVHTTMFGALAAVDMKRKWTIWQIPSPYADFIYRQDGTDLPLFIANGIGSSKIYQLDINQRSDDGVAISSLYVTYGHVNAVKAATLPILGMHAKRYTVLQVTAEGAGTMGVRILPNVINPRFPYSVPVGINLTSPAFDDYFRPINVKGNRAFLEFSTNAVGSWFHLDKTLLTGKADPWSSLNATGGGNAGISS